MAEQYVPFLLFKGPRSRQLAMYLRGFTFRLKSLIPGLESNIAKTNLRLSAEDYLGLSILNGTVYLLTFFLILSILPFVSSLQDFSISWQAGITSATITHFPSKENFTAAWTALKYASALGVFLLIILFMYPRILAQKKAEDIDRNLIFALKEVSLQIQASVPLYNALLNVSRENYGEVSSELALVARDIHAGRSMPQALEEAALRTNSDFLKKVSWQVVNTIRAGANLKAALQVVIDDLMEEQKRKIKDYTQELNVWTLIYLLFAVAIPSIGSTIFIVLSSFAGIGLTEGMFIFFLTACIFVQIALIGLIKSRRPTVYAWKP